MSLESALESLRIASEASQRNPEHQRLAAEREAWFLESTTAGKREQERRQTPEYIAEMVGVPVSEAKDWVGRLGAASTYRIALGVVQDGSVRYRDKCFQHRAEKAASNVVAFQTRAQA